MLMKHKRRKSAGDRFPESALGSNAVDSVVDVVEIVVAANSAVVAVAESVSVNLLLCFVSAVV